MSIPASKIVSVTPRVIDAGGNSLQINGLLISDSTLIPTGTVLTFQSATGVSDYFGDTSTEGKIAPYYFKGFDNSVKKPSVLYVYRHVGTAAAAWIRGESDSATLAQLKAITAGTLTMTIDGTQKSLTAINLATATSFSDVAASITTKFNGSATVTYTSQFNAFIVTSAGSTTASTSVTFATGTLAELLGLDEDQDYVISKASASKTIAETLAAVVPLQNNWVTCTTSYTASDVDIVAMRQWAASKGNRYWIVNHLAWDSKYVDPTGATTHVAATLKDLDLGSGNLVMGWHNSDTTTQIPDAAYAMFEMGMAASVNYEATTPARGKIIYMFKSQEDLPFNCTSESDADMLESWAISYYGDWATANDSFKFFAHGNTWGKYPFIDTAIDAIWLNNEIQLNLVNLMNGVLALPYNEEGYSRIRASMQGNGGPVYNATMNGVIRSGVELSQSQRDQVNLEAGIDIADTLECTGYYIQIKSPSAAVRQSRGTPDIALWYTDGGGIQKIEMTSTVIL